MTYKDGGMQQQKQKNRYHGIGHTEGHAMN